MPPKFNSTNRLSTAAAFGVMALTLLLACLPAHGGQVPPEAALEAAQGVLQHHVALFGHWNGTATPAIADARSIIYEDEIVGFNFQVEPSGHILVTVADELNPVPLYSTTSAFTPPRAGTPDTLESWIVPELKGKLQRAKAFRKRAAASADSAAHRSAIKNNWSYFRKMAAADTAAWRGLTPSEDAIARGAVVAPLLTTRWGQDLPYNLQTPDDGCTDGHTLTGCVATSWSQLMKYWQWPIRGVGGHSYTWTDSTDNPITLSADFSAAVYDWEHMPDALTDFSSSIEKDAVSLLMYHLGVATEMDFGCDTSGSAAWADEVLDDYFGYKPLTRTANRFDRGLDGFTAARWFALFKAELDADPPRPVIFTILSNLGWHEVVVDGYQDDPQQMVHINFGWQGGYDGYYDISDDANFNTGSLDWDVLKDQVLVVGIAPDNNPPVVDAGGDQYVDEQSVVQLSGSAGDPENVGIRGYLWTQVSGPAAALSGETTPTPTVTAPEIDGDAVDMVFQLRADDVNRAYAVDTVTITVANTDGSVAAPAPSSGGGSSGGCFIRVMQHPAAPFKANPPELAE